MNITEARLFNIIFEELGLMEIAFQRPKNETSPIDDDVLKAILSVKSVDNLNEELLSEDIKDRIRAAVEKLGGGAEAIANVAKRLALPIALVTSIAAGGVAGSYLAGTDASTGDNIELSTQGGGESGISQLAGTGYGEEYYGLSGQEKINQAWDQFDLDRIETAPVSSEIPMFKYAVVSYDQIDGDTVLPMIGATAKDYYEHLRQKVEKNPDTELPLLKNMIFGDVGKWLSGEGNQFFKKTGDYNILPPDWSVAHAVYADIIEQKLVDLDEYLKTADENNKNRIYKNLGVESDQEYYKFYNNQLFKIGR